MNVFKVYRRAMFAKSVTNQDILFGTVPKSRKKMKEEEDEEEDEEEEGDQESLRRFLTVMCAMCVRNLDIGLESVRNWKRDDNNRTQKGAGRMDAGRNQRNWRLVGSVCRIQKWTRTCWCRLDRKCT
jgi:hypothetical protein